jgi:hypothetical protein
MFDNWQNLLRWIDSPASDWLWNDVSDGRITTAALLEVLSDFDIPATSYSMSRLSELLIVESVAA